MLKKVKKPDFVFDATGGTKKYVVLW